MNKNLKIALLICAWAFSPLRSQQLDFSGQASSWLSVNTDHPERSVYGARYIPNLWLMKQLTSDYTLDFMAGINAYSGFLVDSLKSVNEMSDIKAYRLWLRLAANRFELRAGLQKISFGSATLLRPLMWFDRIDPRDPLQITDGVYGLLGRYYFQNNSNVWLWGLYGNDKTKGREMNPSAAKKPEFGTRIQLPLFYGEIAATFHRRTANPRKQSAGPLTVMKKSFTENRYALDGKWDAGIGLWFESALIDRGPSLDAFRYQRMLDIGCDYTFDVGNKLNMIYEQFLTSTSGKIFNTGESSSFSAISMNYPLGLLDNVSAIFYRDWKNDNFYRFINWRRSYNSWTIHLMGYWNPQEYQIYQNQEGQNFFTGKGLQVMVVFNH